MLTANFKQILISAILSLSLVGCGGGGGGDTTPPPPPPPANNAPTITSFTAEAEASTVSTFEITYTWAVADADNDALSCVLTLGDGNSIDISDCSATTSTTATYATAGTYTANLAVTDPSNASNNQDLSVTVETPPPVNNAPTISSFSAEASTVNTLEVSYTWVVADADNDALSCVLTLGDGNSETITDCEATTSSVVTYAAPGIYSANLAVSDTSSASNNQSLEVTAVEVTTLPDPSVTAGENELIIFYNRTDGVYTGWGLHLWADATCLLLRDF